ncbi:hypothetical protein EYC80_004140 [Monilinia laxa]|uniref:Uncharacterized protein n=1 Tax=Monilinia laxa TaxID=61186 RepID=A0A5N6KM14_MONLA|nr:hypothetical protein EYC80_004140 [Monilinia laxa]
MILCWEVWEVFDGRTRRWRRRWGRRRGGRGRGRGREMKVRLMKRNEGKDEILIFGLGRGRDGWMDGWMDG